MRNSDAIELEVILKQKNYSLQEIAEMPYWRLLLTIEKINEIDKKQHEESNNQQKASGADYNKMYSNAKNSFKAPSYKMPRMR